MIDHLNSMWANDLKAALGKYQKEVDKADSDADALSLRDAFQQILWDITELELES